MHAVLLLSLIGCEPPCETLSVEVQVQVTDVLGEDVAGALVELRSVACEDLGGGSYRCESAEAGRADLFVLDPRWQAHAEFLELPEPTCPAAVVTVDVLLEQGMGL